MGRPAHEKEKKKREGEKKGGKGGGGGGGRGGNAHPFSIFYTAECPRERGKTREKTLPFSPAIARKGTGEKKRGREGKGKEEKKRPSPVLNSSDKISLRPQKGGKGGKGGKKGGRGGRGGEAVPFIIRK